jgi:cytidine deaminase
LAASDKRRLPKSVTDSGQGAQKLITAARDARSRAVAPFSGFTVGAALETDDGTIVTGCNVENASYGLTMCAERVAVFKAVSEGHRRFRRIAVVADTPAPTPPCGACRQILWEYAGDIQVVLANLERETGRYRMKRLLPVPFDADVLSSSSRGLSEGRVSPRRAFPPRRKPTP